MSSSIEDIEAQIFALRDQVRNENDENGTEDEFGGSIAIDSGVLTSTLVPAMNEMLKDPKNMSNIIEEKKDSSEALISKNDENSRTAYVCAILECMVSFVAATCGPAGESPVEESPTQQTSYNSLSFRRSSTPKKKKKPAPKSRFSSNPQHDKELFVASGAFKMAISVLRQVLEEYVNRASANSWSRNKSADLDTFDSIGVADSSADVKIESTMPENEIPALVMHLIAYLTHNADDMTKSDVLPHLSTIIHKSMMVFLPSPDVQAYGCWTLYNLSNPLLQEMIAAGSVSVLVRAMKCHHTDARVQDHGNKSLYNLLHLLVYCTDQSEHSSESSFDQDASPIHQKSVVNASSTSMLIEIDGEKLEDYSSLLPSLPSIVIRGMEFHSKNLGIQQYGLLVLTRLCQQDKEKYEVVVSEGGLTALLNVVTMATEAKLELQVSDNNDDEEMRKKNATAAEKYDCLVQMACQFLRDLSRPTNSSMDILRIIAVKGGMKTVLKLLNHYNEENMKCGGFGSSDYYGNSQKFAIINIIDPAMACLRNLMTNEDNRREVMTFVAIAKTMEQEHQSSGGGSNPYGDDDDGIFVCANLIQIVLKTMDAYPLDAPIQAYGCDLLGRLAQGEQSARIEIIQTTIDPDAFSASGREARNLSRLWKQADSGASVDDADVAELTDQMYNTGMSPKYRKKVDALETVIRAMKNHRTHMGAQERTVTLILAMVIDRDAIINDNNNGNAIATSSASYYLMQRLQEVYELHRGKNDPLTFLAYLQRTMVPPKGVDRLKTLIQFVDDYDRKKAGEDPNSSRRGIRQLLLGGWNKPGQ
eukprot:CAMPEP_0116144324 /NCGR_PEP_ID=MMETSP0329-20121206/15947_1 /TAXON_ID=697910 /ORGANISM="Pseudo-nitzschia arenysensis, Strain B593" /LENGTH=814 /DNA_ID=CAMNT_0003639751 /DNA_START=83 /DNA_END=2527 /DNA_ORIENTATION=-